MRVFLRLFTPACAHYGGNFSTDWVSFHRLLMLLAGCSAPYVQGCQVSVSLHGPFHQISRPLLRPSRPLLWVIYWVIFALKRCENQRWTYFIQKEFTVKCTVYFIRQQFYYFKGALVLGETLFQFFLQKANLSGLTSLCWSIFEYKLDFLEISHYSKTQRGKNKNWR